MESPKIIHMGGAKGVGKTTMLEKLEGNKLERGQILKIVHVSEFLQSISNDIFNQRLKDLSAPQREDLRHIAVEKIKSLDGDVILLDSHYIDMQGSVPTIIMPPEFEPVMDGHLVLTAPASVILERRKADQKRERGLDIESIQIEADSELRVATELAKKYDRPVRVVENLSVETTVNEVLRHMDDMI